MAYEIVTESKTKLATEKDVREAIAKFRPGAKIEAIAEADDLWTVRLAEVPPFLQDKKEEAPAEDGDAKEDSSAEEKAESPEEEKTEGEGEEGKDGDEGKGEGDKKDPVKAVEGIINELTSLFSDLGGHVQDLKAQHDEKAEKLDEIADTVGPGGEKGVEAPLAPPPVPADVGPVPGGPKPGGGIPPVPHAPRGRGRAPMAPGGGPVPAFSSNRSFEVITHPGTDDEGNRISLVAAASLIEQDPEFVNYEVMGMTENADGTFSAKLKLKS